MKGLLDLVSDELAHQIRAYIWYLWCRGAGFCMAMDGTRKTMLPKLEYSSNIRLSFLWYGGLAKKRRSIFYFMEVAVNLLTFERR